MIVFHRVSGLATNPQKSELLILEPQPQDAGDLTAILGCTMGSFPFTYLGLPLSNKTLPKMAYIPTTNPSNESEAFGLGG